MPKKDFSEMTPEEKALSHLVHDFSEEMFEELLEKMKQGYRGWSERRWAKATIKRRLDKHARRILNGEEIEPIKMANLLAFWWNFERPEGERAEPLKVKRIDYDKEKEVCK